MANAYAPLVAVFSMKSKDQFAGSTTGNNFLGRHALSNGKASSLLGVESVVALLLTCLCVGVLRTSLAASTLLELGGNKSSLSTSTGSLPRKSFGGTARGRYDEK